MKTFALFAVVLAFFPSLPCAAQNAASPKPNIIFIMSDDHAAHAIGAYGGRLAKLNPTPTLDRLASEGMRLKNCFAVNSICTPSRAAILTGQYNHTNQVYDLTGSLEPTKQLLPIELKKAGYQTALVGKWHLSAEPAAFDHYCVLPGQGDYFNPTFLTRGPKPWPQNTFKRDGEHVTDAINELALQWLQQERDPAKPFFLMYHHKAPHDHFEFAPRYKDYLADVDIPEPESLWDQTGFGSIATRGAAEELLPYVGSSVGERHLRRNYVKFFKHGTLATATERKRAAYNDYLKRYLRCVKGVDDALATFFDYLRSAGLLENTLIVYTSDQGMMLGEHDYQDKRWMYEESARMPFLIRYPKTIPKGSTSDALIENVDFAPTLLEFAGVQPPSSMQGRSFKSLCETGTEPADWRKAVYYRYWMHMAHHFNPAHLGIRTQDFKLVYYYGAARDGITPRTPPGWELYDLRNDPHEMVNVYDKPAYASTVSLLKTQLAERRTQVGDNGRDFPDVESVVQEFWNYDDAARAKAVAISHAFHAQTRAEQEAATRTKPRPAP
jgi:arylsulfatase A-like enzyme